MPELTASGDLFTFGHDDNYYAGLILHQRAGAGARIAFAGQFELCHGLSAELSLKAIAEFQYALAILLPALRVEGAAFLAGGVRVDARLSADLFETCGFAAMAKAHAEASVAGRIALGLDFYAVSVAARQQLPGFAYDIFVEFLNQLVVECGVWGKASFSAQASAHYSVKGSLADDADAGFTVEAGASAAWGTGTGWDSYYGFKLNNPKQFYNYATERITAELVREARRELPPEYGPAIELLDFVLPLALQEAYVLGQQAALNVVNDEEFVIEPFVVVFFQNLQRYMMEKFAAAGERLLRHAIDDILHMAAGDNLSAEQREELIEYTEELIRELSGRTLELANAGWIAGRLLKLFTIIAPKQARQWRQPIAILWVAASLAAAMRDPVYTTRDTIGLVGFGTRTTGEDGVIVSVGNPPDVLMEELEEYIFIQGEGAPPAITFGGGVNYLLDTGVAPVLADLVPELSLLFETIEREFGITAGDVAEAALLGKVGVGFSRTQLYRKLRAIVKGAIDGHIVSDLLPALRASMSDKPDALIWLDDAAEPCLLATSGFVFDQLDVIVDRGVSLDERSPFFKSFCSGLSALVAKIVVRNVVVLTDILLHHTIEHLHSGMSALSGDVRGSSDHAMVGAAVTLIPALLPPDAPPPQNPSGPTRELVADLLDAGAEAFGPGVWTEQRRTRLRQLTIRLLLSVDGNLDYKDADAVKAFFDQMRECLYCPDLDGLGQLLSLLADITADEARIVFRRVVPAMIKFHQALTAPQVAAMDDAARQFLDEAGRAVQSAWEDYQRLKREAEELEAAVAAAAVALSAALEAVAAYLDDQTLRGRILDRVKEQGHAQAETNARNAPGFNLLSGKVQEEAIRKAVAAFDLAFEAVRPVLEAALSGLGGLAGGLSGIVAAASDSPAALSALAAKIRSKTVEMVNAGLRQTKASLPSELSAGTVGDAAAVVVTEFKALELALTDALTKRDAEKAARNNHDEAVAQEEAEKRRWEQEKRKEADLYGDEIAVEFISPAPLADDPRDNWSYAAEVEVAVRVRGARQSFVRADGPTRILLALNSAAVHVEPSEWTYESATRVLTLRKRLSVDDAPLRAGANHLECSVTSGAGAVVRESVIFAVNPDLPFEGRLEVDTRLSVFDTPGDDHQHLEEEQVVLRNTGTQAIQLAGWRVLDRAQHRFTFPDMELYPGQTVSLHTGPAPEEPLKPTHLYWNRRRAVWNNRGDLVIVTDPDGVARATYLFLPRTSSPH